MIRPWHTSTQTSTLSIHQNIFDNIFLEKHRWWNKLSSWANWEKSRRYWLRLPLVSALMEDSFWKCLLFLFAWILEETQPISGKTTTLNITILWTREASRTWVWLWSCSVGFWVSPYSLVVGVILGADYLCVLSDWQGCVHKSSLAFRWAFAYFPEKKSSLW